MSMNRNPTGSGGFKPGVSGNPGGRPRIAADVKALAMTHTTEAIETLVAIMRDKKAAATSRGAAAAQLLDRAIGKPEVSAKIENSTVAPPGGPRLDLDRLTESDWTVLESLRPILERAVVKPRTEH